ncbi:hypothetical protein KZZ52_14275 [Dactylosporangium sp. AC04546]|nr:hypothetical protein [Dactylosporangium sp. AC04546]WVK86486.1 hypothetical protein KZZ52_14275 [Dactylosporangium sp. AC04546]
MSSDQHDEFSGDEQTRDPGASALTLIGVLSILLILGFIYTVMSG